MNHDEARAAGAELGRWLHQAGTRAGSGSPFALDILDRRCNRYTELARFLDRYLVKAPAGMPALSEDARELAFGLLGTTPDILQGRTVAVQTYWRLRAADKTAEES